MKNLIIEGSLEVKLPTIWRDDKQSREVESEDEQTAEKRSREEDTCVRNVRKVAKCCVFPLICGSVGSKSRLAKAAGAEPCRHRRNEKLHGAVARSTFSSQVVQKTPFPGHFWKFRCGKIARRCGAKRIFKSKCGKHTISGPLFEVQMWNDCTKHVCNSK